MERFASFFVVFVTLAFIGGCSSNDISDEEIANVIREAKQYPKLLKDEIHLGNKPTLQDHVTTLVEDGSIKPNIQVGFMKTDKGFEASEEFSDKIVQLTRGYRDEYRDFLVYTHVEDIGEITDRQILENGRLMQVEYTVTYTPTEYAREINELEPDSIDLNRANKTTTEFLQKWESGWRINE